MKYRYRILLALLVLLLLAGCAHNPSTQPVPTVQGCRLLANGTCDATDVRAYRILVDCNVFLKDIRDGVASGKLTLNAAQKVTFNALAASSNSLDAVWQLYHSGQSNDSAGLANAANKLNSDLAAAQSQIIVVK